MEFPIEKDVPLFPLGFKNSLNETEIKSESDQNSFHNTRRALSEDQSNPDNQSSFIDIKLQRDSTSEKKALKQVDYVKIFSSQHNSEKLISKFQLEKKELTISTSPLVSHTIADCKTRLFRGYYLFKYNFNTPQRQIVNFKVTDTHIELRHSKKIRRVLINAMHGVLFGAVSSTFRNFKKIIDRKSGKLHKFYHCFSLVTEFRTYDFATLKDNERMDMYIFMSLLISLNSNSPTSIPFSKRKYY